VPLRGDGARVVVAVGFTLSVPVVFVDVAVAVVCESSGFLDLPPPVAWA